VDLPKVDPEGDLAEGDLPFDASEIDDPPALDEGDLPFETRELNLPYESAELELPFDTSEVTPLRLDDPAPQRVAQYPAGARKKPKTDQIPTQVMNTPGELSQGFSAHATARPVFLYVERGPGAGQLMPVAQGKLLVGRSSSSDLRLQHPSISRRHAELTRTGERFFLKDLSSQNGTYVNRARLLAEREVFPGDTLGLGTAILKLRGPMSQGLHPPPHVSGRPRGLTLAIFASAVGFGLAGILLYALLRTPPPSSASVHLPPNAPVPVSNLVRVGPIVPVPPLRHAEEHEPQHQAAQPSAPVATSPSRSTAEPERPAPIAKRAVPPSRIAHPSRRSRSRAKPAPAPVETRADGHPSEPEAAPAGREAANVDALDAYRQGDLSDALRQATGSLVGTLTRFQTEYNAGRRALAAHDAATASRHFKQALAVDRDIASGEGTFNGILRREIAELKTLQEDEPAQPTKKPAAESAPSRSAIDDAFSE